eukprot:TRINITY_DN72057_c0_g1_i1.p1 TRINITY_DN72057_c0_g1~~TRINITY_DN72057_c0_g1_i1.p1  ORF type:complete len:277 (-),score=34.29 TRINITY_DN72057_c0_g1_i1:36-803(-)
MLFEEAGCHSDQHSRARTTLLAIQRLGLISRSSLLLHVAGAEWRGEGGTCGEVCSIFDELFNSLASAGVVCLRMALVGPSALQQTAETASQPVGKNSIVVYGRCKVEISHLSKLYHEACFDDAAWCCPDLVIAFQPGIWGYDSWEHTVKKCLDASRPAPLVLTSYNAEEADLDWGSLEDMGFPELHWRSPGWPPEENPCAASTARPCKVNKGNSLKEQHWWQCLVPAPLDSIGGIEPSIGAFVQDKCELPASNVQ